MIVSSLQRGEKFDLLPFLIRLDIIIYQKQTMSEKEHIQNEKTFSIKESKEMLWSFFDKKTLDTTFSEIIKFFKTELQHRSVFQLQHPKLPSSDDFLHYSICTLLLQKSKELKFKLPENISSILKNWKNQYDRCRKLLNEWIGDFTIFPERFNFTIKEKEEDKKDLQQNDSQATNKHPNNIEQSTKVEEKIKPKILIKHKDYNEPEEKTPSRWAHIQKIANLFRDNEELGSLVYWDKKEKDNKNKTTKNNNEEFKSESTKGLETFMKFITEKWQTIATNWFNTNMRLKLGEKMGQRYNPANMEKNGEMNQKFLLNNEIPCEISVTENGTLSITNPVAFRDKTNFECIPSPVVNTYPLNQFERLITPDLINDLISTTKEKIQKGKNFWQEFQKEFEEAFQKKIQEKIENMTDPLHISEQEAQQKINNSFENLYSWYKAIECFPDKKNVMSYLDGKKSINKQLDPDLFDYIQIVSKTLESKTYQKNNSIRKLWDDFIKLEEYANKRNFVQDNETNKKILKNFDLNSKERTPKSFLQIIKLFTIWKEKDELHPVRFKIKSLDQFITAIEEKRPLKTIEKTKKFTVREQKQWKETDQSKINADIDLENQLKEV